MFQWSKTLSVSAALGMLALTSCSKPAEKAEISPTTVTVVPAEERELQDFVIFTGRTDAKETVEIRARVSGYLQTTNFKDGQMVKAGDVLFQIDPREYQSDLDAAKAEHDRAQADLQLASVEYSRASDLRKKNTISAADFDLKAAAYLSAQGALASTKASMDKAALNLEFTRILSPIDGRIGKAAVTPGNLITPELKDPLAVVVSTNPVYAYADIDERQLLKYVRLNNAERAAGGDPAKDADTPIDLQLADEKDFPHRGVIDFADNRVNPETGTILIRGVFEDTEDLLGPGLFVRLRFPGGPKYRAVLVPQISIAIDQGQNYVLVVDTQNTVSYRQVTPGALQDDGWAAIQGDVKAGENVIVDGIIKVRPGDVVKTEPWKGSATP